ncbi:MAG TPA: arylamine N-acetyltransferase [Clostridiales bacterium]|jgi:N-hydroxyarylamine O-acetyltransferase|nr:arylamine N-acetyltransferase [Clostridiales bacterium]HRT82331.1 arylamine N-acetyltransferase [Oscillospiraceae bacterium]
MDKDLYLKRIGFEKEPKLNYETLKELQYRHLCTVPYENLDILKGIPIRLDAQGMYEKIVLNHRGGYCFELNGAFGALLRELGFEVTDCMARFLKNEKEIPMRRHRVLKVRCDDGLFLCDVGVGMICPVYPVSLDTYDIQNIGNEEYRISKDDFLGTVLWQCLDGEWDRFFSFTDEPQLDIDYIMPSFYCEKHPDSPFIVDYMLAIQTPFGGKNALNGNRLTYWDEEGKHKKEIETEAERREAFEKYFNLKNCD